jgi:phosphoglycerate dehydrogenase-like enzyme
MTDRKRVFVPSGFRSESMRLFEEAGMEVVYAIPEHLPAWGGSEADERARREAYEAAFERDYPSAHALCAIGLGGQLAVTGEMMDAAPDLEVVFVPSAGTDAIDVAAATERGIAVINAAGNNYASVSEQAVGLMLSLVRHIGVHDREAHRDHRWVSIMGGGGIPGIVHGKTIGVVGFGFIGKEVCRICTLGFRMRALAYDPYVHPVEAERQGVQMYDDLHTMLAECDVVSVHCALTEETRHIIDASALDAMKQTAWLINASRGPTVDIEALVRALQDGQIAGAGLDVTDPEPLPAGHPLFDFENVIITPHAAGAAPEMIVRAGTMSTTNAVLALQGERPRNLVNPEVWPAFEARRSLVGEAR